MKKYSDFSPHQARPNRAGPSDLKRALSHIKFVPLQHREHLCLVQPEIYLESTIGELQSELVHLERIASVGLINPAVLGPASDAVENMKLARKNFRLNPVAAQRFTSAAIRLQIESLIEGYRHTAASYVIEAREVIEACVRARVEEKIWLTRHSMARDAFVKGRQLHAVSLHDDARESYLDALNHANFIVHTLRTNPL